MIISSLSSITAVQISIISYILHIKFTRVRRKKVVQISVLLFVKLSLKILYSVLIKQQQKIIAANCILYVLATNCICNNSNGLLLFELESWKANQLTCQDKIPYFLYFKFRMLSSKENIIQIAREVSVFIMEVWGLIMTCDVQCHVVLFPD